MGFNTKGFYIDADDKIEIQLIAAEVNASSVQSFLSDLFLHWIDGIRKGNNMPVITPDMDLTRGDRVKVAYIVDENTAYYARIEAVKLRTNLANYYRAIVHWLCDEHRANGRVWIDDTDVRVLPVRTRK